jgi:CubicO group peptidase (beta-lactamase class C family)
MTVSLGLCKALVATLCAIGSFALTGSVLADSASEADGPRSVGFSEERLERIGAWYQARVDENDLSGSVVAIAKGDQLAYLKAIGFQDRNKTVAMKSDSIFWIASLTKPVTSVAAMILVDAGKLDLDAPVSNYLPDLGNMKVGAQITDPATGKTELALEPPKRPMVVRDLLRHTSGLVYPPQYVDMPINRLYTKAVFDRDKTLADFVTSLASLPLAHQPGEVWEYSWGIDVLARIVEVVSGQSFDQFLASRIFEPLSMVDTGFFVPQEKLNRLVEAPIQRNPQFDVTRPGKLLSGGAGLVSTAEDYLRFCQMLLNGGELAGARILKEETVRAMTSNSLPPGIRFLGGVTGPNTGSSWGLGFNIRTDPKFSYVPGSVGSYSWNGLWGTYFWIDPHEKLIVVQMIQVAPSKVGSYYAAIRNLTYGALLVPNPASPPSAPAAIDTARLEDYAGRYSFGLSSSSRDRMDVETRDFVGIGVDIEMTAGGVRVKSSRENGSAADAGIQAGDLITEIDDAPVSGLRINQAVGKLRGPAGSQVRLKIMRPGQKRPVDLVVTRVPIHVPLVELQFRMDAGRLVIEATGPWPILEFENGKPIEAIATSDGEFYANSADRTRISFFRDSAGKVAGLVLNPGPQEMRGMRISWPGVR